MPSVIQPLSIQRHGASANVVAGTTVEGPEGTEVVVQVRGYVNALIASG